MSNHYSWACARALQLFSAVSLLLINVDANAITAAPSPSVNGSYTVSWNSTALGCWYEDLYPYYPQHCYSLQENGVDIAWSGWSLPITGKPPGTYTYQIYYRLSVAGAPWDEYVVDGPVSIFVGQPPPRDSLTTQLTYQYETRAGDINFDGKTDIFVRRTSGGVAGNGTLEQVILRQNSSGGTFSIVVPNSSQSATASAWPASSAVTVVDDLNVDGYVDVAVKGLAAATGASVYDQIVYSPAAALVSQPLGIRAVDASLKQFVGNSLDYFSNPDYFIENATLQYFFGYYYYYYCNFYPYYYGVLEGYYNSAWYCSISYAPFDGYYWDYSAFDGYAVSIWSNEAAREAGTVSGAQSAQAAKQAAEQMFGVQIGGWPMEEVLGTVGDHTNPDMRRGLEVFWAILGIGRAYAAEVPTEEAPPQGPRPPGPIYYTKRKILGFGEHSAIEYNSHATDSCLWATEFGTCKTISAFDSDGWPPTSGTLVYVPNAIGDSPKFMMEFGKIYRPGQPNALAFADLMNLAENYDQGQEVPYDYWPNCVNDARNSNGFTVGLLKASNKTVEVNYPYPMYPHWHKLLWGSETCWVGADRFD